MKIASCFGLVGMVGELMVAQFYIKLLSSPVHIIKHAVIIPRGLEGQDSLIVEAAFANTLVWVRLFAGCSPYATLFSIGLAVVQHYPNNDIMSLGRIFLVIFALAWVIMFSVISKLWVQEVFSFSFVG